MLRLLVETSRGLEGWLHEGMMEAGYGDVRPAQYAVFRYLGVGGSRVTELAEAAGIKQQSMGELVDQLERRGYVERRPDPRDGRARIVVLTEAGKRGIEAGAEHLARIERTLAGRLGEGRLEALILTLQDLSALLAERPPVE